MIKSDKNAYGDLAKLFHWTVGLAILAMLPFGFYMEGVTPDTARFPLYGIHKSIGITILILMAGRACWRTYTGAPLENPVHPVWERKLALAVHILLYIAAILMPLSGWGMSSAGGHPVSLFGLPLPPLVSPDPDLGKFFSSAHSVLAWTLIGLLGLHVLGALKHHFIDKDNTLKRMLP